jgi:hypothetical protein
MFLGMRPARVGWELLTSGLFMGVSSVTLAIFTFQPGFGWESGTVFLAWMTLGGTIAIGVAVSLLRGRPLWVPIASVLLGAALLIGVLLLARDIPEDVPGLMMHSSRVRALWLLTMGAFVLLAVGGCGSVGARSSEVRHPH